MCNRISADHQDPQARSSYRDFFNNSGQLKIFGNQKNPDLQMPHAIGNAEFTAERALLNKLKVQHSNHPKINQALFYIQNACSNSAELYPWQDFAHLLGTAILEGKEDIVSITPDFSIPVASHQELIKIKTMNLAVSIGHPEIGRRIINVFLKYLMNTLEHRRPMKIAKCF